MITQRDQVGTASETAAGDAAMNSWGAADREGHIMSTTKRTCARCGTPLSRYTQGEICGPCVTAARLAPKPPGIQLPLEFWFSDPISRALARWDWSTLLVAVHNHAGATQSAIASQTGMSQGSISRLMAGRSGGQTIETALKIVDGLGAPRTLAGLTPKGLSHLSEDRDDQETRGTGTANNVNRREFSTKLVLAGLTIPLIGRSASATGADVDIVTGLDRPADAVADLYALDAKHGGAALVELAEARLSSLLAQLKQITLKPSDEPFVYSVVGQVNTAAAWFAYERGDLDRAENLLKDGLYAAHCASDVGLRLQVLNILAMVSRSLNHPAKAVAAAQGAIDAGSRADPQLRALLSMRLSLGHARLRDAHAYERFKGEAWDLLGMSTGQTDPSEWFRFFGEEEMHGLEAIGQTFLGRHAEAADLLEDATASMPPRNRAYYRLTHAEALARSGNGKHAIDVFHENLPLLTEMTSARITDKVRDFAGTLHAVPGDDAFQTRRIALSLIGESPHA
ncbi:helix-turn-helix domain-containing protein [Actinomadura harenae]|uniref:helix-turn-helix domain-containing protein n=1 Tax=Actinomadura harenae TaxID=2483351 RepID=UPI0011C37016|nr:helix-turn-helix transcriptional regulator [Actinomadura harenae]